MRLLQLLIMALLATAALNSVLLAESTVAIGWDGASCSDSGTSAQCSIAATIPDPDFPEFQDQVSASGYVLSAPNSLTLEFNYHFALGNPDCFFQCFQDLVLDLGMFETGVLNLDLRLSTPAPPGSVAIYQIAGNGFPIQAFCLGCSGGGYGSDAGTLVETSGIFQSDFITIEQPVSGNFLAISASFQQFTPLGFGAAELPEPLPETTYSIFLMGIFDAEGNPIDATLTPVPEPASFCLLLSAAELVIRRSKALRSIKFRRAYFNR